MPDITDPPKPTTAIPELVAMPLRSVEFQTVALAATAVNDLLVSRLRATGGASLRCRIELAAAILLGAIDHGRDAALDTGQMQPDAAMALVVNLVGRRAMEIWGQGGAWIRVSVRLLLEASNRGEQMPPGDLPRGLHSLESATSARTFRR